MTTYTKLDIELEFGIYNGTMSVDIYNNNTLVNEFTNVTEHVLQRSYNIVLPSTITFKLTGKTKYDTKVIDGKIIADKFVKLNRLVLGNIPVSTHVLFNICNYQPYDGQLIKNTFWGFNGVVTIELLESSFIKWHFKNQNLFDL